jgi:hypothetical protein
VNVTPQQQHAADAITRKLIHMGFAVTVHTRSAHRGSDNACLIIVGECTIGFGFDSMIKVIMVDWDGHTW